MIALPRLIVLTDRRACARQGRSLAATVTAAAGAGAEAVLLREKDLPPSERRALGEEVAEALAPSATRLIVTSDVELASHLGTPWVHLAAADPQPCVQDASAPRSEAIPGLIAGRSCHTRSDLEHASREGVAYVTLSPVFPSPSKPGYGPPLGLGGLAVLCRLPGAPPAHALGGITSERVAGCLVAGARGVAVMGAVMAAEDPGAAVLSLRAALDPSRDSRYPAPAA